MGLWLQSELPVDEAAEAAMTTLMVIHGMIDQEAELTSFETPDDDALAWHPNLRVAFSGDRDRDAAFDLVVRSVMNGLYDELVNRARVAAEAEA